MPCLLYTSMGYNGLPTGCSDDEFPWVREGDDPLETKYVYTVHSELNAILNYRGGSLEGAKLYEMCIRDSQNDLRHPA